jgi:hypothetical protein
MAPGHNWPPLIRTNGTDLDRQARESYSLELYRQDRISHPQLRDALGVTAECLLARGRSSHDCRQARNSGGIDRSGSRRPVSKHSARPAMRRQSAAVRCRLGELVKSRLNELVNRKTGSGGFRGEPLEGAFRYSDMRHRVLRTSNFQHPTRCNSLTGTQGRFGPDGLGSPWA